MYAKNPVYSPRFSPPPTPFVHHLHSELDGLFLLEPFSKQPDALGVVARRLNDSLGVVVSIEVKALFAGWAERM